VTRNVRILVAVVVTAALAGGYWQLVLAPKRQQAAKLSGDIAKQQTQLTAAQSKLETYRRARADYRANYATLVRLGKAVPGDDDTRSLIVELDAAAKRAGVDFRTVSVGATNASTDSTGATTPAKSGTQPPPGAVAIDSTGFAAMPFSLSFRGDFSRLSNLFARLQRFVTQHNSKMAVTGRLLRVESLDFKPDQELGFPHIRAVVSANSYLLPATDGLTAGGAPSGSSAGTAPGAAPTPSSSGSTPATTTATVTGTNP
jgi:Tfp pilus assembly protein PilO